MKKLICNIFLGLGIISFSEISLCKLEGLFWFQCRIDSFKINESQLEEPFSDQVLYIIKIMNNSFRGDTVKFIGYAVPEEVIIDPDIAYKRAKFISELFEYYGFDFENIERKIVLGEYKKMADTKESDHFYNLRVDIQYDYLSKEDRLIYDFKKERNTGIG